MELNFYQYAQDLLGTLPAGFDFVYVLFAIVLAVICILIFIALPFYLILNISKF